MDIAICGSIDWAATGSMLSGWGTIIGACAVIYAAHKGSDTFKQWRRQKNEERRIDLAEQVLTLAYKIKRAIEGIRSPMMLAGEVATVEEELRKQGVLKDNTPGATKGILTTAQGTLMRLNHYKDLWDALIDITPVSKAIFGDEVEKQLNEFWSQRNKIAVAASSYARFPTYDHDGTAEQREQRHRHREELEKTLWFGASEDGEDTIAKSINGAITRLEASLLPAIRADLRIGTGTKSL